MFYIAENQLVLIRSHLQSIHCTRMSRLVYEPMGILYEG